MPPPHVVVIGGGLAGLAASIALADHGIHVSLLEKNPRVLPDMGVKVAFLDQPANAP